MSFLCYLTKNYSYFELLLLLQYLFKNAECLKNNFLFCVSFSNLRHGICRCINTEASISIHISAALLKAMFHVPLLYFEHLPLQRSLHGPGSVICGCAKSYICGRVSEISHSKWTEWTSIAQWYICLCVHHVGNVYSDLQKEECYHFTNFLQWYKRKEGIISSPPKAIWKCPCYCILWSSEMLLL